jgi:hypothetical protein
VADQSSSPSYKETTDWQSQVEENNNNNNVKKKLLAIPLKSISLGAFLINKFMMIYYFFESISLLLQKGKSKYKDISIYTLCVRSR